MTDGDEAVFPGIGRIRIRSDHSTRRVEQHSAAGWRSMTRAQLLALPVDGPEWEWLRAAGMRRPSPSGPSGPTTPAARRSTVQVSLRLARDDAARLRQIAAERGSTVSGLVATWIDSAAAGSGTVG
jgi:hypothetical protein